MRVALLDSERVANPEVAHLIAGIYIKSFEFKKEGEYSPSDLDQIRAQLKSPEWSRIVGVKDAENGENLEVWVRTVNGKVKGVAILAAEPKELTVANLVGSVDLNSLAELGGHFGLPRMEAAKNKTK